MKTKLYKCIIKTMGVTLISLLLVCNLANCQVIEPTTGSPQSETYDFHIKKYHDNKKAYTILGITGGVSLVTGFVVALANTPSAIVESAFEGGSDVKAGSDLSSGLMIGGGVAIVAAIPFYLKAKDHEKKASLLIGTTQSALENTKVNIPKNIGVSLIIPIN